MCAKKAEALQSKIEDVKSEAIDDISRTMEENGRTEYKFIRPGRYGSKTLRRVEYDPEDEQGPIVIYDATEPDGFYGDQMIEIDELDADEVLIVLRALEDEYKVS